MELLGVRPSSPAGTILQHIQRTGSATIKDLEQVLGVSTTAVREHLAQLQVNGLVAASTLRAGPGRPRLIYTLTEKAESLFPKHYDLLVHLLLEEMAAEDGIAKVERILGRVGERIASEYSTKVNATDMHERMQELRQVLERQGIAADVNAEDAAIHLHSCPYYDLVHEHGEVCRMEQQMLEQVLGEKLVLERSRRDGHYHCCFVLEQAARKPHTDGTA